MRVLTLYAVALAGLTAAVAAGQAQAPAFAPYGASARQASAPAAAGKTEKHLANIRQLTQGGENAEAYFSADGSRLIFQSTRDGNPCDQIFTMKPDGSDLRRISNGTGRTTCGYYYPSGAELIYASTDGESPACPSKPSFARGYVWPIYASYDIYRAKADGSQPVNLTRSPGYDAEATIAPDGLIVFTSVRDGDMEIYSMKADGSDVKRLTNRPGPDGGPFFSWDGKLVAFRGRPLQPGPEFDDYKALLKEGLWRPTLLELYVMGRDGSNMRQLTKLGGANFAPSWHPDGKRLVFASNIADPRGRNFDIYMINLDGTSLERITYNETFDGFPMFSPDGKRLVFASNRNAKVEGETNVFIADWVQ